MYRIIIVHHIYYSSSSCHIIISNARLVQAEMGYCVIHFRELEAAAYGVGGAETAAGGVGVAETAAGGVGGAASDPLVADIHTEFTECMRTFQHSTNVSDVLLH